ncbi:GNAT family N-acetyltransferase [Cochlodiniinecator piscidefendens]|uniref:GNAT family N-acetyltransferase n=1 Tax=Cochlodiniinecator piscidefendens TaxID=2715756 RepID=UPI001409A509|nr:GNAT family N-acetyltransferase [Cochlodiniinecator piscidefendens]
MNKTNPFPHEHLTTERLRLRPISPADAGALSDLMSEDISKWVASWPFPITAAAAAEMIEKSINPYTFYAVITLADSDTVIGCIKTERSGRAAEIGYWIGNAFQRKGYLSEAATAVIDVMRDDPDLKLLIAGAQLKNNASHALLEKLGFAPSHEADVYAPARDQYERCQFWQMPL